MGHCKMPQIYRASSGAIVDAILDLKAKDIGLFSILKSEYPYAINDFNYETMPQDMILLNG